MTTNAGDFGKFISHLGKFCETDTNMYQDCGTLPQ